MQGYLHGFLLYVRGFSCWLVSLLRIGSTSWNLIPVCISEKFVEDFETQIIHRIQLAALLRAHPFERVPWPSWLEPIALDTLAIGVFPALVFLDFKWCRTRFPDYNCSRGLPCLEPTVLRHELSIMLCVRESRYVDATTGHVSFPNILMIYVWMPR